MKRLISHEELARDRRFKRVANRNSLLGSLPDDAVEIAKVLEKIAPSIQRRIAGTELEQAYEEMGPGFQFLTNLAPVDEDNPHRELQLKMRLHGIFVGELQALEAAGRTLWDFPDAPWEFKMNMARQCWDEARHVQIYEKLMDRVGCAIGAYPESTFLFEVSCADDPVYRVAGVNRCLEGLACDTFRDLVEYGRRTDDPVLEQAVDYVLADELTHVRFGSEWVREFCRGNPEKTKEVKEFQREVDRRFSFGGSRSDRKDARLRIAREERLEAGFTEEELDELASISREGPRRETLLRAAELVRDRHVARKQGQTVAPL